MADVLTEMFPGARFLHILRDGREVVHSMQNFLSLFKQDPKREEMIRSGATSPWATNFHDACKTWRDYTEAALQFADQRPERCLTVRHDSLRRDPPGMFRRIFEFLQLEYQEGPAKYFRSNRLNSSFAGAARSDQRPDSSARAWASWTPEQRALFADVAGGTQLRCGFCDSEFTERSDYDQLVADVKGIAKSTLSPGAHVVVVSKGDPQLLELTDCHTGHFPQLESGEYSGWHPADAVDAISELETVRSRGAEFLILPRTAFWWLNHYAAFAGHLDASCRLVWRSEECIIYALPPSPSLAGELRERTGRLDSEFIQ